MTYPLKIKNEDVLEIYARFSKAQQTYAEKSNEYMHEILQITPSWNPKQ